MVQVWPHGLDQTHGPIPLSYRIDAMRSLDPGLAGAGAVCGTAPDQLE